MPRRVSVGFASVLCAITVATAPHASAQAPGAAGAVYHPAQSASPRDAGDEPSLFDDTVLHDIEITFEARDWQQRLDRMDPARPEDLAAALKVDGQTLDRVGARYKGNTS